MMQRSIRGVLASALALTTAVALAACGSSGGGSGGSGGSTGAANLPQGQPGKGKPAVTLGDKNFAEEFVLGQLYTQALQAKGYKVNLKGNLGSSELVDKLLTSGKIDAYPEYTGVIQQELAHINKRPTSAAQTYKEAQAFENKRGFKLLEPTPFQDADRVAVKPAYAKKHGLKSTGDLKKVSSFTYGGPPENRTRFQGVVGMKKVYGLNNLKFVSLPIGVQYQALNSGKVDTIAVFTTDGQLVRGQYTVLTDPKNIFGFQQVAPVVSQKVLKREGPEFAQTLNAVSAKLTTKAIQTMNAAVVIDKQDPKKVAQQFLKANGLL